MSGAGWHEPAWWYRPPGMTAAVLGPVSQMYGFVAARRLGKPGYRSRLPVICVGNLTAGGTGKTPFTLMIAMKLVERGERPAILTRGYGGRVRGLHWVDRESDTSETVGDEPLLCAAVAPTLVSADRKAGAIEIEREGGATVIVMDDGLQNPGLYKDLSFALIDGVRGLGNGRVIPAGPLRAPLERQWPLVDCVVLNGGQGGGGNDVVRDGFKGPRLRVSLQPWPTDAQALRGRRVVAFAGIGHPERFFQTLRELGAVVVETVRLPDHSALSLAHAEHLLATARRLEATLVTTSKDQVRFKGRVELDELAQACLTLPVGMTLSGGDETTLDTLINQVIERRRP